ncbi:MAG: LicD family protein [Salinivirgaceae bacterium]|nr:LicD family protein [Salinivirgaceae bacterium]
MNNIEIIHDAELDTLNDVIRSFEKHGIKYYLGFGTLLGAIRHQGFIPWDDDVDLFIPRPDFEKIKRYEKDIIPQPYILSGNTISNNSPHTFILRIENPLKCFHIEKNGRVLKQNVWLDLFPIDGMPSNRLLRMLLFFRLRIQFVLLRIARSSLYGVAKNTKRSYVEKCVIAINKVFHIGRLFNLRNIVDGFDKILKKHSFDTSKYVCPLTIDYMEKCICDRDWFGDGIMITFENIEKVVVPIDSDAILKNIYGDYKQLPPIERRHPKHSILINESH